MSKGLSGALAAVARTAALLCRASDAQIMLVEGERLRVAAHERPYRGAPAGATVPLGRGTVVGAAAVDRRTVHVRDLARATARGEFPEAAAMAREQRAPLKVSVLAAPLVLDGRVVGAIALRRRRVQPFTAAQVALLDAFAGHAAVAIESARRGDALAGALTQQAAEAEILGIISRSPGDLQPVLDKVVESTTRVCGAADTVLILAAGDALLVRAHHGPIAAHLGTRLAIGRGSVSGRAFLERITVQVEDPTESEEYPDTRALARRFGHRTTLATPLLRDGVAIGTIVLRRIEARLFTEREIAALRSFADQAVIAIENARLFTELEARNRDLKEALTQQTATAEILRVISSSPTEVRPVFDAIATAATTLCEADFTGLFRFDGNLIYFEAHHGWSPDEIAASQRAFPQRPGRGSVTARAIVDAAVVQVSDVSEDPDVVGTLRAFRTVLSVPMVRAGRPVGAITVARRAVRPFSAEQVALLQTFAEQAVIAIENVRLFTELEARNHALTVALDQQTATAEILRVISRSQTDAQPVFEAIAEAGLRLCQGADVAVFTFDGELLHLVSSVNMVSPEASEALRAAFPRRLEAGSLGGRAVLAREVVEIPDAFEEPDYPLTGLARATRSRSLTGIPLLRDGAAIGSIVIGRQEPGRLSPGQIALLQTFADQAVIAIENARLFNELEARNRDLTVALDQQTATAGILRAISQAQTDVGPVFEAIADSLMRLLGTWSALVFRHDGERLHLVAARGGTPGSSEAIFERWRRRGPLQPDEGTLAGLVVLTRAAQQVEDTETETRFTGLREGARERGFRSTVQVPMLLGGEVVGIVAVTRREPGAYAPAEIALLETFADQAVIAIENVRLFTELERRNRDLTEALDRQTATAELLRVVSQSRIDVQPVFDAIAGSARRLCRAAFAGVFTYDGAMVDLAALDNFNPEGAEEIRRAFPAPAGNTGASTRAISSGAPVIIADVERDADYGLSGAAAATGFRSVLSVPMVHEGRPIGTITVTRAEPGTFDDGQVELLKTFADQAVIAVENARLLSELEGRNHDLTESLERQTATAEILRVISSSPTDTQPVFAALLRSAVDLSGSMFGVAYRYDGARLHVMAHHNMTAAALDLLARTFPAPPGSGTVSAEAIARREPVQFADAQAEAINMPDTVAIARALGYHAIISVPMLREEQPIGTIALSRREPQLYTDKQVALLQTFADQAVIAIENVRLFTELGERNRALHESLEQQTATSEILQAISRAATDLQPVFDAIATHAVRLAGALFGSVYRLEDGLIHMVSHHNYPPAALEFSRRSFPTPPGRQTFTGRAILERRVVHVADVSADEERALARDLAEAVGFRSALSVPMLREGSPIGAITVWRAAVGPFPDNHVALLQTFADQAVIAIENARLLSELEGRNRDLTESLERQTATAEILRVISEAGGNAQPVFEAIAANALRLLRGFSVIVVRVVGERLELVASFGGAEGSEAAVRKNLAQLPRTRGTFMWDAVLDREIQHIADVEEEPVRPLLRDSARARGFRAILAVPMLHEGEPIGVIAVSRQTPGPFSPQEIDLLRTFADQAAIAVKNADLLTDLQARTAELTRSVGQLTALGEVGQAVSSSLELETVLTTIVTRAVQLTGVDDGVVFEYDEATEEFSHRAGTQSGRTLDQARRGARIPKGEGVLGRTAITHEAVQVPDIARAGVYESRLRETLLASGVRALLAVPMLREGRLLGGLVLSRLQPGEFPPETVELLRTFATQSAVAIQNARLYRELAEQGRQLEVASRHKSEFLASMSHELRTPLNAILGFNEMILGDIYGEVPPEIREPLTEVQTSGRHLLRLINNVLDLSKIEAGRMELALADYAVPDVVEQVRTSLQPLAADKGLEFVTAVPADLPLARGDAGRITQCLTNLAGNALKFTREGRVEIAAELRGETLVYRVSDTGIGIPPDRIETLFTEFRQADPTIASEFGGSGLGLSITRKFAEMHGGRVWAESEPGRGSTFFLALPLRIDGGATE